MLAAKGVDDECEMDDELDLDYKDESEEGEEGEIREREGEWWSVWGDGQKKVVTNTRKSVGVGDNSIHDLPGVSVAQVGNVTQAVQAAAHASDMGDTSKDDGKDGEDKVGEGLQEAAPKYGFCDDFGFSRGRKEEIQDLVT
ncbi:hypothetical protein NDU88_003850 [Pleurodeles waltl]|uniref:Uncharacterized protein n=1 Tax=Pleurodeles waltl TaxID=8319 RepID=A0AAV7PFS2_PLEWA|nr:hypothetical protein NDU88_003850 [Pleurodeles waltl]